MILPCCRLRKESTLVFLMTTYNQFEGFNYDHTRKGYICAYYEATMFIIITRDYKKCIIVGSWVQLVATI